MPRDGGNATFLVVEMPVLRIILMVEMPLLRVIVEVLPGLAVQSCVPSSGELRQRCCVLSVILEGWELLWAVSLAQRCCRDVLEQFGAGLAVPRTGREAPRASQPQLPPPVPRVIHARAPALTFLLPARSSFILLLPFYCKIMDFFFLYGMCEEFRGGS